MVAVVDCPKFPVRSEVIISLVLQSWMLMDHPKSLLMNCLLERDPSSLRKCPLLRGSPLPVRVDMGEQRRCTWLSLEWLWLAIQVQDLSWDQLRLCCNCATVNFSLFPILLPSLPYRWVPAGLAPITSFLKPLRLNFLGKPKTCDIFLIFSSRSSHVLPSQWKC